MLTPEEQQLSALGPPCKRIQQCQRALWQIDKVCEATRLCCSAGIVAFGNSQQQQQDWAPSARECHLRRQRHDGSGGGPWRCSARCGCCWCPASTAAARGPAMAREAGSCCGPPSPAQELERRGGARGGAGGGARGGARGCAR
ncbi:unnamed protein product, partial [Prorocentrum cordatum]